MIDGVQLIPRTRHADDRGFVTEILRSDEDHFRKFGQAYVTACYPGVVKAWHRHVRQIDFFYAVVGTVKVGLYDDREGSPTRGEYQTVMLGESGANAQLVIPDTLLGAPSLNPTRQTALLARWPSAPALRPFLRRLNTARPTKQLSLL